MHVVKNVNGNLIMKKYKIYLLPNNQPEIYYGDVEGINLKEAENTAWKFLKKDLSSHMRKKDFYLDCLKGENKFEYIGSLP